MERRKRGIRRNLPKIDQYCLQPVKETKTTSSVSASCESLPQSEKEQAKESPCGLKIDEKPSFDCSDKSRDMSALIEDNSKTAFKTEVLDDMDDSVLDFKAPTVKKRKIQAKLSLGSKQRSKDKAVKCSIPSAVVSGNVECVTIEPTDVECSVGTDELTSSAVEEVSEERNQGESTSADEAQQKGSSLCPVCWKRFDKVNVVHLKACAAKHNMTTAQLMDAMALQDRQTAEREALGLPAVPCNQSSKKPSSRKGSGTSGSNDPNLQLALALSASMHEAEEQQILQEEDALLEAGLGQEVIAKQKTLLERFGFTSSRPALVTTSNPRPRGKHKLKGFPTLLLRTQEERDRLITEKVALILIGDENATSEEHYVQCAEFTLNSKYLQQFLNEEHNLWIKASASPSRFEKSAYYVGSLSHFISPSKVEAGSKLKHLSQVPCRLKTPPKDFPSLSENEARSPSSSFYPENNVAGPSPQTLNAISPAYTSKQSCSLDCSLPVTPKLIKEEQELQGSSDSHTCHSRGKSGTKVSSSSGFIDDLASDWRSILNKSVLSDITIYVKNRLKIPAHELVLYVRCPAILNDIVKDGKGVKYLLWTNVSFRPTMAFLEYVYCGSVNKILTLAEGFEDVHWLIERYEVVNLLKHLEVVADVRLKVNSKKIKSEIQCDLGYEDIRGETINFKNILSPKYKSPEKHHLGLSQTTNSSVSRKCGNEARRSLEFNKDSDLNFSSGNVSKRSLSPDPFSESRINDVKCLMKDNSNIIPSATQDNMDYLLELIDSSAPMKNQSSDESDTTVNNFNTKNELSKNIIPVEVGVLHSDSETVVLSNSQHSHGSDFSNELAKNELVANVNQVHEKVNSYCENLSLAHRKEENIFYQGNSTENDVAKISEKSSDNIPMQYVSDDSPSRKIEHPDKEAFAVHKSSFRGVSLESFTEENKSVPMLQQQNEVVVVCDLTQSSDDSDQETISLPENQSCTPTGEHSFRNVISSETERNIEDLSKAAIGKKHSRSGEEVFTSGSSVEELCNMQMSKENSSSDVSKERKHNRILQKFPDENKRKCFENGSPCKTNSPVSKKLCTDHNNPVRKSLIESFVTESVGCARQKDEDLVVFDLTQVSDYDHKAISPPLGPSSILKSPSINHRCSPKRKVSNKFLPQHFEVDSVHSQSLEKIKKIIESDLSLNNGSGSNIPTESDCNDVAVINHSPSSYGLDDDMDSCPKSRTNVSPNHGDSQGNSSNGDMNHQIDYFDYYDSPCKPYISTLDSTNNSFSEKQDVTERERLSSSQNNSFLNDDFQKHPSKALSQDDMRNKSCDIIELEIDLKDTKYNTPVCNHQSQEVTPSNNSTPKLNKRKSSIRKSLDACKRLLDDSFGDKLGNLSLWKSEFNSVTDELSVAVACSTPKGMLQPGSSTPKTPVQMVKAIESHDVTPLADYSAMDSPMLKKQLHKYGIKPLKRKQAKIILRHIYNELHPLASVTENTQRTPPSPNHFKEPDGNTKVPKSPAKRNLAKQPSSPLKKGAVNSASQQLENESEDSDCEAESSLSSSQCSSISSSRSDLIAADDVQDEPGLTQREPSSPLKDLPEVVRNFILSDPELHQKVLLYEPIWLEQFYEDLKAMNYKFKMDQLMHYFDGQCITFRTSQQQRTAARKEARKKKSPKKKPKTTKYSQKKKEKGQDMKKSSTVTSSSQSTDSVSR